MMDKPYMANRTSDFLSKFFNWCEANGYRNRGSNPVVGLEKYKEEKKMDFLDAQEMGAIGQALAALETAGKVSPLSAAAIRLLLLTGMRLMEMLSLKWDYLDLEAGAARLPDSKTGFKVVPLSAPAVDIFKGLPNVSEYVFPTPKSAASGHLMGLRKPWKQVCEAAHLGGRWRVHDLRHGFASAMVNGGASLPIIGAVLGHKRAETTARYAHIGKNPAQEAAEAAGAKIAGSWVRPAQDGIIPFQPKRAEGE
jgi:integrase